MIVIGKAAAQPVAKKDKEENKGTWGGRREGSGRPLGARNKGPKKVSTARQEYHFRIDDDLREWLSTFGRLQRPKIVNAAIRKFMTDFKKNDDDDEEV